MQQRLVRFLALAGLVSLVLGHAKLVFPPAWNPQPSKSTPCGGGPQPSTPLATLRTGDLVNLKWTVVAGDGAGNVNVAIDTTGGTNVAAANFALLGGNSSTHAFNAASVGDYDISVASFPSITCTQTKGCTIFFNGPNGWNACSSIKVVAAGTPVQQPPQNCKTVYGLSFCDMRNGLNLAVTSGTDPVSTDVTVAAATYYATINNTNVFSNGNDATCQSSYKTYVCATVFPVCGQYTGCQAYCQKATSDCGLTVSHQDLYQCDSAPTVCSASTQGVAVVMILAFVALLALFF